MTLGPGSRNGLFLLSVRHFFQGSLGEGEGSVQLTSLY
jgi:hypothetical protein